MSLARGRRRVAGAALCLGLLLAAAAADAEGLLLRAQGEGRGQAWLFGSLHFASADLYPLSEPIERAWAAADRLMVEVDVLSLEASEVATTMDARGRLPRGDSLRRHVPESVWQRLFLATRTLEVPLEPFERQRPWLAALNLSSRLLERYGLSAAQGVDQHFLRRARRAALPIIELESFEAQIRLFAGIPLEDQVTMLEDTLAQVEAGESLPMELLGAWRAGDPVRLERILLGGLGSGERGRALARRLLSERNGPMADHVALEVARGGSVFVVVGAAHLIGEGSLPAELERRGLRVAPP